MDETINPFAAPLHGGQPEKQVPLEPPLLNSDWATTTAALMNSRPWALVLAVLLGLWAILFIFEVWQVIDLGQFAIVWDAAVELLIGASVYLLAAALLIHFAWKTRQLGRDVNQHTLLAAIQAQGQFFQVMVWAVLLRQLAQLAMAVLGMQGYTPSAEP